LHDGGTHDSDVVKDGRRLRLLCISCAASHPLMPKVVGVVLAVDDEPGGRA